MKRYTVFFDFDNTITRFDVIDDMLERFSKDDKWIGLEKKWKSGRIGSRECLDGQMRGIRITKARLDKYLRTIKIDPYFAPLTKMLASKRIRSIILSDDFDYILKSVLKNNAISGPKVYSNSLKIIKDRVIPSFPFTNKDHNKCAHCKKENLLLNMGKDSVTVYIGDGLSDVCPAKSANIVFAKEYLAEYFKKEGLPCIRIKSLKDVYNYFKRRLL